MRLSVLAALLSVCCSISASAEIERRTVRFEIEMSPETRGVASGEIVVRPTPVAGEVSAAPIKEKRAELSLPVASHWIVGSSIQGWWMPELALFVEPGTGPLVVKQKVWPTGHIRGSLATDPKNPKARLPTAIFLRVDDAPAAPNPIVLPPKTDIRCDVGEKGVFDCDIPSGFLDLAVRATGFVPVYKWGIRLDRGGIRDLGGLTLKEGSSLSGWATIEGKKPGKERVHLRLVRIVAAGAVGRARERLERPVSEAEARADGFFQLSGFDAGVYSVVAEAKGFAPAKVFPVEVYAGTEAVLQRPLIIRRPVALTLNLNPLEDWLNHPWRVSLYRIGEASGVQEVPGVLDALEAEHGSAIARGLAPSDYKVEADHVPVPGAYVKLVGSETILSQVSDEHGHFVFRGAAEGQARLSAEATIRGRTLRSDAASVPVRSGSFFGPYELVLSAARTVRGKVVILERPVAGATVHLTATDPNGVSVNAMATTDLDGAFTLDISQDATSAVAVVSPPGYSLRAFSVLVDGRILILNVQDAGGALHIKYPAGNAEKRVAALLFYEAGKEVSLSDLYAWARGHGVVWIDSSRELTIPALSPDSYRVCVRRVSGTLSLSDDCKEVAVVPGATSELVFQ
jgi:hypothetical protein